MLRTSFSREGLNTALIEHVLAHAGFSIQVAAAGQTIDVMRASCEALNAMIPGTDAHHHKSGSTTGDGSYCWI